MHKRECVYISKHEGNMTPLTNSGLWPGKCGAEDQLFEACPISSCPTETGACFIREVIRKKVAEEGWT